MRWNLQRNLIHCMLLMPYDLLVVDRRARGRDEARRLLKFLRLQAWSLSRCALERANANYNKTLREQLTSLTCNVKSHSKGFSKLNRFSKGEDKRLLNRQGHANQRQYRSSSHAKMAPVPANSAQTIIVSRLQMIRQADRNNSAKGGRVECP